MYDAQTQPSRLKGLYYGLFGGWKPASALFWWIVIPQFLALSCWLVSLYLQQLGLISWHYGYVLDFAPDLMFFCVGILVTAFLFLNRIERYEGFEKSAILLGVLALAVQGIIIGSVYFPQNRANTARIEAVLVHLNAQTPFWLDENVKLLKYKRTGDWLFYEVWTREPGKSLMDTLALRKLGSIMPCDRLATVFRSLEVNQIIWRKRSYQPGGENKIIFDIDSCR